jgi:hypothetical protein
LRALEVFLLLFFEDFAAPLDLDDLALRDGPFDFELLVDLLFLDEARAFDVFPLFFTVRFAPPPDFPLFFDALPRLFEPAVFDTDFALAATALTAFLTFLAPVEREAAARPARAPITPPTTAPTGPATLPRTAPVAAPAVCLEIGGISMFSDDEPDESVDF